jgi:peroxiredoxin
MPSMSRRIFLVLPAAAVVIVGLIAFKLNRRYEEPAPVAAGDVRPAPLFKLYDEHSQIVRLERYISRKKLLIVFFDGSQGPEYSELLERLRDNFAQIHAAGGQVLAISESRPSQNRYGANLEHRTSAASDDEIRFPFPLLSDISTSELAAPVHREYGAFDEAKNQPREGVFVVDRAGLIQYTHLGPDRLGSPAEWVHELEHVR